MAHKHTTIKPAPRAKKRTRVLNKRTKALVHETPGYVYANGITDINVKEMTRAERAKIYRDCVPGLRGKALDIWIQEGKGIREQLADVAQAVTPATQATSRIDEPEKRAKRHRTNNVTTKQLDPKETKVTTVKTPKQSKKSAKAQPEAKQAKALPVLPVTTREVAEAAGVSPRELRVFLRANSERYPKPTGSTGYGWKTMPKGLVTAVRKASK